MRQPTATYEQPASSGIPYRTWTVAAAIDQDAYGASWGWAVGPKLSAPHAIAFETSDIQHDGGIDLSVDLKQHHGEGQMLGRFRISVSSGPRPVRVLPDEVADALKVPSEDRTQRHRAALLKYIYSRQRPIDDVRNDEEWARYELRRRISDRVASGDFSHALRWSEQLVDLERNAKAGALDLADALLSVAKLYTAEGRLADSKMAITQLLEIAGEGDISKDWRVREAQAWLDDCQRLANDDRAVEQMKTATRCNLQAAALVENRPARAIELAKKSRDIYRILLGESNHATGRAHHQLGAARLRQGRHEQAAASLTEAVRILEGVYQTHPDVAWANEDLATCFQNLNEHAKAHPKQLKTVTLCQRIFGNDHLATANARMRFVYIAYALGDHRRAIDQCSRAIDFFQSDRPRYTEQLAEAHHLLGLVHQPPGEFYQATVALERALYYYQQLGPRGERVIPHILFHLGTSFNFLNREFEARRDWEEALALAEANRDSSLVAWCCAEVGAYHLIRGEYAVARPLLERSLKIHQRANNEDNSGAAYARRRWGEFLGETGELKDAERFLIDALAIYEKLNDPNVATCLATLAEVQQRLGKSKAAMKNLERAVAMTRHVSPAYVFQRASLGLLLTREGRLREAEELLQELWKSTREHFDEKSRERFMAANALARFHQFAGSVKDASEYFRQALEIRLRDSSDTLPAMSEAEALAYQKQTMWAFEDWFDTVRRDEQPQNPRDVHELLWRCRGLVVREQFRRRAIRSDPEFADVYPELRKTRRQLADLYGNGDAAQWSAAWRNEVVRLSRRKELLERKASDYPPPFFHRPFRTASPTSSISQLVAELPQDAAIVEFIKYRLPAKAAAESNVKPISRYDAFIVRRDDSDAGFSVVWRELGLASTIDALIDQWRKKVAPGDLVRGFGRKPAVPVTAPEKELRKLVWEPIEEHLAGCSLVVLVPDENLWRLPWPALPGSAEGRYLLEEVAMVTANHGLELYEALRRKPNENEGVLLLGDVDFGKHNGVDSTAGVIWKPLPNTESEIRAIQSLWTNEPVTVLSKSNATEDELRKALPQHRLVHLATHGHFADESFRAAIQGTSSERISVRGFSRPGNRASVSERNPLLMSRLILANANLPPKSTKSGLPEGPDGIMTAEEVIDLDLSNVDLIILSSCETGLGNVVGGEGVFGLQRAFRMAGARSVVASLWRVDDLATEAVMTRFHRNLAGGKMSKLEALREAQLAMLRGKLIPLDKLATPPPVHAWAGWMLGGDWR